MKLRSHQKLSQRGLFKSYGAAVAAARWHDGAAIDYLGNALCLKLDTDHQQATRENETLHLPLPPDATERQIQDAAESWLRREAEVLFPRLIANLLANQIDGKAAHRECRQPKVTLSFSLRGSWTQADGHILRLNWRLIEQPLSVIELTLRRAAAQLPAPQATAELF